jgi:hypothetical protein
MLVLQVAEQHVRNRQHALVCEHCFRYIGPLELQLGYRLLMGSPSQDVGSPIVAAAALLVGTMHLPASVIAQSDIKTAAASEDCPEWLMPQQLLQLHSEAAAMAASKGIPLQSIATSSAAGEHEAGQGVAQNRYAHLGQAVVLQHDSPYLFCSHDCAAIAWSHWCALLSLELTTPLAPEQLPTSSFQGADSSTGKNRPICTLPEEVVRSPYVQIFDPTKLSSRIRSLCTVGGTLDTFCMDGSDGAWNSASWVAQARPPWLPGAPTNAAVKMQAFYEHANCTNDIMRVAARAVAMVASVAFMRAAVRGALEYPGSTAGPSSAMLHAVQFDDVQDAWKPFQAIHSRIWWEHVPMPSDLSDEMDWSCQLKYASQAYCPLSNYGCLVQRSPLYNRDYLTERGGYVLYGALFCCFAISFIGFLGEWECGHCVGTY